MSEMIKISETPFWILTWVVGGVADSALLEVVHIVHMPGGSLMGLLQLRF